ncbi:shikimate dehydrogenase [Lutibacter sp. Hel_I_33_5]|uniref:shikimate dehydrogenase family protein n=1 Tax=Lutibacter sp. Hel_I_33_5 TaxID=1566289 RepID=UPI0011A3DF01|nr:shikimate dehydrogenase [Lutibacter sp. Hel_I_33_5]TVZ57167.1 shikimate dehydrogenase [Lutibacter sp. Hel_I_33_5]
MTENENKNLFALLGKNISYSFSKGYFTEKFKKLNLENHQYINFDIQQIEDLAEEIHKNQQALKGMNVTIPYKQEVMPFLDSLHKVAKEIGAVNTIKFTKKGKLKGYNTDVIGFKNSIVPLLKKHHKKALILGTGGASKAIAYAFKQLDIPSKFVSRTSKKKQFTYQELTEKVLNKYQIIVNCSPLGTHPNIDESPNIPYQYLTKNHLLFDLIYNPTETTFLSKGKEKGATIKNGFQMLELQAEASWKIWNK